MVKGFSAITVSVPDVEAASVEYQSLLGPAATRRERASWPLANVAIELREAAVESPHIDGVAFWAEGSLALPADSRGLSLSGRSTRQVVNTLTATGIAAVDHIVLRTSDADDCIRLFGDRLGLRLALDQTVPEWGGRMLFFRSGKLTLEVIQAADPPPRDFFWGISYQCPDLESTLAALSAAGVQYSPVRPGRKPGTRVVTVKSHTLGIPTLLIEPAARSEHAAR